MSIVLTYPAIQQNFPRSYIKGFVANVGMLNLTFSGHTFSYDYLSAHIHIDLVVTNEFFNWNSNVYSLDHIFDGAASQAYVGGLPVVSSQGIRFWPMQTEPAYRIYTIFGLGVDETKRLDLPPAPPGYWRVQT